MLDDVTTVFLDTDELAETITREVKGDPKETETVLAIVFEEALPGTNERDGDGVLTSTRTGQRIRESAIFEMAASQTTHHSDSWLKGDDRWKTKRIMGRDDNMQAVLVVKNIGIRTRRSRLPSA